MNGRHTILVTGATGTTGRPLVDLLVGEGAEVRDVTRTPRAAGLPAHVEVVEGDPVRPETIAPFLAGATAVFLHSRATGLAAGERSIRSPTAPRTTEREEPRRPRRPRSVPVSMRTAVPCPGYGELSRRRHRHYERWPLDLPPARIVRPDFAP
jgi:NAD(P)-dependent dehydrogenase (short-subunit alcohol dehydrogenase family)